MPKVEYYVVTVDSEPVGPVTKDVIAYMVKRWQIGPDSPIRKSSDTEWATMCDVAGSIGVELPSCDDWSVARSSALSKERANAIIGVAVILLLIWGGLSLIGLGFIFMPLLIIGILFVVICMIFSPLAGTNVLAAPMWTDIRKKPIKGQGWQLLAFCFALVLTIAYYAWRLSGQ